MNDQEMMVYVQAAPNWNGAAVVAEARFTFPHWWKPELLRFQVITDATVADRLVSVDLFGQEAGITYPTTLRAIAGGEHRITASLSQVIVMSPGVQETCINSILGQVQGQLFPFTVGPNQTLRLSLIDMAAGDTVQGVRLHYRRLG